MSRSTSSAEAAAGPARHELVLEPSSGWKSLGWRELWQAREVLYFLTWRDIKVRYKHTSLGIAWALFQPALMTVVFSWIMSRVAGLPAGELPYPAFVYAGMVAWVFFSTAITSAGNSVLQTEQLVTKVYFPRLAIPFAAVGGGLVGLAAACLGLPVLMLVYGIAPTWSLVMAPVAVLLLALLALGLGAFLAALTVAFRDVRHVLPFVVQLMLFGTPAIYMVQGVPGTDVPAAVAGGGASPNGGSAAEGRAEPSGGLRPSEALLSGRPPASRLLDWHPLNTAVATFRAAVYGQPVPWRPLGIAAVEVLLIFVLGTLGFRRFEDAFADII